MQSIRKTTFDLKNIHLLSDRQHLKFSIPRPMRLVPTGHTLTNAQWNKFYDRQLVPANLARYAAHTRDGSVSFINEQGFEAAKKLQEHSPMLHFKLYCDNEAHAALALKWSQHLGLSVVELEYIDKNGHKVCVSDFH